VVPTRSWQRSERTDLHNCSVGTELADAGLRTMTQLSTGRVCLRVDQPAGSCRFASKDEVAAVLGGIRPGSVAS
jgi:hypothetical protein